MNIFVPVAPFTWKGNCIVSLMHCAAWDSSHQNASPSVSQYKKVICCAKTGLGSVYTIIFQLAEAYACNVGLCIWELVLLASADPIFWFYWLWWTWAASAAATMALHRKTKELRKKSPEETLIEFKPPGCTSCKPPPSKKTYSYYYRKWRSMGNPLNLFPPSV